MVLIVSRTRMYNFLESVESLDQAHDVVLFLAMRLLISLPEDGQSQISDETYRSLKAGLGTCESHGELSTNFLAAQILTCFLESANALFPAAYFTAGSCYRTCCALGLHDKRFATQLPPKLNTWTEAEERRRLWWAAIILDRQIHVGFMFRPLYHIRLDANETLPACDDAWDRGMLTPNHLLVMSIETRKAVSPFARTCQAAHLLGKVCQHANESVEPEEPEFHLQEAYSIQKTLAALLTLLHLECFGGPVDDQHRYFGALGLCYSALFALYNVHFCIEDDYLTAGNHQSRARDKNIRIDLQQLSIEGFEVQSKTIDEFTAKLRVAIDLHGLISVKPIRAACFVPSWKNVCLERTRNGQSAAPCLTDKHTTNTRVDGA